MERQWQLQEAKARFSEVVERALEGETQIVTKRGKKAVVVIAHEEYERLTHGQKSLLEIFQSAPDVELTIERDKTPVRPFEFE
jgi:prevent-host-death family protein